MCQSIRPIFMGSKVWRAQLLEWHRILWGAITSTCLLHLGNSVRGTRVEKITPVPDMFSPVFHQSRVFCFPRLMLLDYLKEDGQPIDPTWYAPIIPMVLVNGCEGIGTGWSTFVPNYNPRDVVENVRPLLRDEPMQPMEPWYKRFKGHD